MLGRWARDDTALRRTSVPGQDDELGASTSTPSARPTALDAYRLRLTLRAGRGGADVACGRCVRVRGAREAGRRGRARPAAAAASSSPVPAFSQSDPCGRVPGVRRRRRVVVQPDVHGDGARLLGRRPDVGGLAWVDAAHADPWVDHAARHTYDAAYGGCGNWPFNTAYAAGFGLDAFVTRLRSLREAELFLEAGIPLVASIAAGPGELDGFRAPQGTAGHLVVTSGFTADGRPDRQRPGRADERGGAAHLRPGAVRAGLARRLGRRRRT